MTSSPTYSEMPSGSGKASWLLVILTPMGPLDESLEKGFKELLPMRAPFILPHIGFTLEHTTSWQFP